jgi:hypothetical protein
VLLIPECGLWYETCTNCIRTELVPVYNTSLDMGICSFYTAKGAITLALEHPRSGKSTGIELGCGGVARIQKEINLSERSRQARGMCDG